MKSHILSKVFKKNRLLTLLGLSLFFSGCASIPNPFNNKETTRIDQRCTRIMGQGGASKPSMQKYLLSRNQKLNPKFADHLTNLYIEESEIEGINHDVAFVQMCHETNFLKFGGQVAHCQNNFAGIGATDNGACGANFPSPRIGVRAQIQHLKAYASTNKPVKPIVDPRYEKVRNKGRASSIYDLAGTWATDPQYGEKLKNKLYALYNTH